MDKIINVLDIVTMLMQIVLFGLAIKYMLLLLD